ncbi:MAG: sigma-70 family RNA polymerase sigma factor [Chthonomonadaceae bacterium]|nr:sigma-70 family RNA polymerase sigma factor [Chthonomonadaceae bacterium]
MNTNTLDETTTVNTLPNAAHSVEDRREFTRLMERTQRQAYNMAYRMTGNRDDAEDLTQEAYLRAFRSFGTYNRQLPFESWFFRILSNLFIDLLRRRPKQKPLSLDQPMGDDEGDDNLLMQIQDDTSNPERNLMEQVMDEKLQSALSTLPETFRTAVLLCDVEGLSYEEIAVRMSSSIGTVRSRIHRGRLLLREAMNAGATAKGRRRRATAEPLKLQTA